ncbi:MAG: phosphotransferase family protein [Thermoplasmata archaeon]
MTLNDSPSLIKGRFLHAIRSVIPDASVRRMKLLGNGWDNYVIVLDNRTVFRFPRFPDESDRLQSEAALLNRISHEIPIRIPDAKIEDLVIDGRRFIFSHYEMIPGMPLRFGSLRFVNQDSLSNEIAGFLRTLHDINTDDLTDLNMRRLDRKGSEKRYTEILRYFEENIFPVLDRLSVQRLENAFSDYFSRLDRMPDPVLIHGDMGQGNILFDRKSSRITGIIDWEDSIIGDPALDLAGVLEYFHGNFFRRVLSLYGNEDDEFLGRVKFYWQIAGYYAFDYGMRNSDQEMIAAGIKSLSSKLDFRE